MKSKTLPISLIIVVLIASTACSSINKFLGLPEYINSNKECRFYTATELEELYYANKESFKNVAEIILASDKLLEWMDEQGFSYDYIYMTNHKRFFSDSEWDEIVHFFKMSQVFRIKRSRTSGDSISFEFGFKRIGEIDLEVILFYFPQPTDELLEHHSRPWNLTEFYPIDTNWWIRVCETPR